VKEKQRIAGSYTYLTEEQKIIALRDSRENYKIAQDLALSIEATMWHALSKNKTRIDPNYTMKTRELLNYLTDDNNSELRVSILIGERKPEDLCKATGKVTLKNIYENRIRNQANSSLKDHYFFFLIVVN